MPKGKGAVSTVLRENDFELKVTYPAKLSFLNEGNWKTFLDMQGLRKYISQIPFLKNLQNAVTAAHKNKSSEAIVLKKNGG